MPLCATPLAPKSLVSVKSEQVICAHCPSEMSSEARWHGGTVGCYLRASALPAPAGESGSGVDRRSIEEIIELRTRMETGICSQSSRRARAKRKWSGVQHAPLLNQDQGLGRPRAPSADLTRHARPPECPVIGDLNSKRSRCPRRAGLLNPHEPLAGRP